MNNWLEYFPENVLERGYSYHLHGFVRHLNYTSKYLSATVSGTEDYKVVITWDEKTNMTCDCLYAIEGKKCKHMAAVLFAYEERPIKNPTTHFPNSRPLFPPLVPLLYGNF
nr:SWIM zinc finger family protein [Enterococcus faecium]